MNIDVAGTVENRYDEENCKSMYPLIQIYCVTRDGNSVCVNVRNFVPYFFAPFPDANESNI
jgi:DNA polymerase elongation subunit (family B)